MKNNLFDGDIVAYQAIETLRFLQYGGTEEDVNQMIKVYEELEQYELCQGLLLGIEYFNTKVFNCKIGNIYEPN